jgi:spoIIIJ-associated protein
MEILEIEGKTIDEAIENACNEFQVPREKLNIEIVSEGIPGFLGIGAKKAKIRASLLNLNMNLSSDEPHSESGIDAAAKPARPSREKDSGKPVAVDQTPAPVQPQSGPGGAAAKAKSFLEGLLERMDLAGLVSISESDEQITLNIEGNSGGLLIGKRGQNLDAIQYLVNKVVKRSPENSKAIFIDTESYRKRREESLVALAEKIGQKVKKTNEAVTISHLNAHDRRIIHLALQGKEGIMTKSRGEGEFRKIIILPAKK